MATKFGWNLVSDFNKDIGPLYEWYVSSTAGVALPAAWDLGRGDSSTVIAVMDNGFDIGHPDLAGQVWINRGEDPGNGRLQPWVRQLAREKVEEAVQLVGVAPEGRRERGRVRSGVGLE